MSIPPFPLTTVVLKVNVFFQNFPCSSSPPWGSDNREWGWPSRSTAIQIEDCIWYQNNFFILQLHLHIIIQKCYQWKISRSQFCKMKMDFEICCISQFLNFQYFSSWFDLYKGLYACLVIKIYLSSLQNFLWNQADEFHFTYFKNMQ